MWRAAYAAQARGPVGAYQLELHAGNPSAAAAVARGRPQRGPREQVRVSRRTRTIWGKMWAASNAPQQPRSMRDNATQERSPYGGPRRPRRA